MKCDNCGSEHTIVRDSKYTTTIKGREVSITCKRRFCTECSKEVQDEDLEKESKRKAIRRYNEIVALNKDRIMEIRKGYNLSQELFSKIIGCAKKTLVCYEKGTSSPNDNFSIILNTLVYKPRLIVDFVEANKDNFTSKQYETIMKKINTKK